MAWQPSWKKWEWGPIYYLWKGKIPWRRAWQPTLVFLPGESHRKRSLVGVSPWPSFQPSPIPNNTLLLLLFTSEFQNLTWNKIYAEVLIIIHENRSILKSESYWSILIFFIYSCMYAIVDYICSEHILCMTDTQSLFLSLYSLFIPYNFYLGPN